MHLYAQNNLFTPLNSPFLYFAIINNETVTKTVFFSEAMHVFNFRLVLRKSYTNTDMRQRVSWTRISGHFTPKHEHKKESHTMNQACLGSDRMERYLNAPPYSKGLQLASDPTFFRSSNQVLDAQRVNFRGTQREYSSSLSGSIGIFLSPKNFSSVRIS